jgi:N-acetylglutamate synthase-like GNAT family acetyltransferase
MKHSFIIRRASLEDLDAITHLLKDLDYHIQDQENFKRIGSLILKQDPTWAVFMALRSDKPVGFISIHVKPILKLEGHMASIEELVVQEGLRGSGVGSALLDKALSFADELHCSRIEVLSSKRRESYKRQFYTKHGFMEHPSAVFRINKV